MDRIQNRPGWAVPSRPDSRASMNAKTKPKANAQHRYAAHHQHARSVSSESHWLRFGTLEDVEAEKAMIAQPRKKPLRFTRPGGCFKLFDVVGWKLRRGFWRSTRRRSQDSGKGGKSERS
ncbi:hypothetical protein TWF103_009875 [Orbilia oligospora]|nr:hypothetical protein TWF103_009875 [Orbilia oligospora]